MSFSRINKPLDLLDDPQVLANEYFVPFSHPEMIDAKVVGFPVKYTQTPTRNPTRSPELGESTEEILLELGYSWDKLAELREGGII